MASDDYYVVEKDLVDKGNYQEAYKVVDDDIGTCEVEACDETS